MERWVFVCMGNMGGMNAWEREGGVGFSVSLKEKAREDGGRVRDREAQEGGMERIRERTNTRVSVRVSKRKDKIILRMQDFPSDISDSAATVAHTQLQGTKKS